MATMTARGWLGNDLGLLGYDLNELHRHLGWLAEDLALLPLGATARPALAEPLDGAGGALAALVTTKHGAG